VSHAESGVVYAVGRLSGGYDGYRGIVWRLVGAKGSTNVIATDCTGNLGSLHTNATWWEVKVVCLDQRQPGVVLVTTTEGVFLSTNATTSAASWEPTGFPVSPWLGWAESTRPIAKLLFSPEGVFYAYGSRGVYQTRIVDGKLSWTLINCGLTATQSLGCESLALDTAGKRLYLGTDPRDLDTKGYILRTRIGPILNIVGPTNPATGTGAGSWTNWYGTAESRSLTNTVVNGTNLCVYWSLSGGQTDTNGAVAGLGSVNLTHTKDSTLTLQWLPVTASNTVVGVIAGPGGTVSPAGATTATQGVPVAIEATASNGYVFASWQVMAGTATLGNSNTDSTTVTLDAPATIRANFHDRKHILVTSTNLSVPEGGTSTFQVKLAGMPAADVSVAVARTSGDADITVQTGTNLTFTTGNWDTYQTVTLAAAEDADVTNGVATMVCSASGMDSVTGTVTEVANDTVLTLAAGVGGTALPSGTSVVTMGVATQITAKAGSGYAFTAWKVFSGSAIVADIHAASTTVTITAPATVQAYFVEVAAQPPSTVWAWGLNTNGELGDGTSGTNRLNPVQTVGLSNVTAILGGQDYSVALDTNGNVWTWGWNGYGQLGDGTTITRLIPVRVSGVSNITAIAMGRNHTVALQNNGKVWAWGNNGYGQLGDGTLGANRLSPVQVLGLANVTAIATGPYNAYALNGDGTVSGWGQAGGYVGDGTTAQRLAPVTLTGISNVIAIASGSQYQYAVALKSDHTVWAWGDNRYGQLGDGTTTLRKAPVQVMMSDGSTPLSDVTAIVAGIINTLAIRNPQPHAGIVSDRAQVSVPEGGTATFQVKLAAKPMGSVSMVVGWLAGDTNISVSGGASLTFGTNDWNTYQTVTLAAAEDSDTADGQATIACWVDGLGTLNVTATEQDNDTTLTFTAGPGGTTGPSGPVVVTKGVARDVCAFADAGYVFTNWTVTTGSVTFGTTTHDSDSQWTTFMTINSAATVRANFVLTPYEAWRRASFTTGQLASLAISGDAADPDQDGMNNQQEYVAHTDPTNQASVFQITGLSFTPYFQVQFLSASDRLYTLNGCTNLVAGGWRTVPGQVRVAGTGGLCTLSDTHAAGLGRFYRLLVDLPDVQNFAEVSATAALGMVVDRQSDADFVVLDVRTPAEYNTLHILGAINRDFLADGFEEQLKALDKNKAYLIHCRTGGRSGIAYGLMQGLGFHEVYNLIGGIEAFEVVPGAGAWLVGP
jgi:rhodanese-related sulfurtransferase